MVVSSYRLYVLRILVPREERIRGQITKFSFSPLYVAPRGELSEFANLQSEQRPLGPCPDAEFPSRRHRGDPAGGPPQLTLQVAPVFPPAATVDYRSSGLMSNSNH